MPGRRSGHRAVAVALCLLALGCGGSGADDAVPPLPSKVTVIPSGDTTPVGAPTTTTSTVPVTTTSLPGTQPYTVQPGDTLTSVATRYGFTLAEVTALNALKDPGSLSVGQVIVLPPPPTTTVPAAPGAGTATGASTTPTPATGSTTTGTGGTTTTATTMR